MRFCYCCAGMLAVLVMTGIAHAQLHHKVTALLPDSTTELSYGLKVGTKPMSMSPPMPRLDALRSDSLASNELQTELIGLNRHRIFWSNFKYDTSPQNPENRCYDIRQALGKNYIFVFNFLLFDKYK